jgi:hypothetical protein
LSDSVVAALCFAKERIAAAHYPEKKVAEELIAAGHYPAEAVSQLQSAYSIRVQPQRQRSPSGHLIAHLPLEFPRFW